MHTLPTLKAVFEQFSTNGLKNILEAHKNNQLILDGQMVFGSSGEPTAPEEIAYG
jgi:hypothetical protein